MDFLRTEEARCSHILVYRFFSHRLPLLKAYYSFFRFSEPLSCLFAAKTRNMFIEQQLAIDFGTLTARS